MSVDIRDDLCQIAPLKKIADLRSQFIGAKGRFCRAASPEGAPAEAPHRISAEGSANASQDAFSKRIGPTES